ncbi:hypothetical protein HAX54_048756, partial [Datura stramonium]|nr:hypothetical protein [Datura stramonium]
MGRTELIMIPRNLLADLGGTIFLSWTSQDSPMKIHLWAMRSSARMREVKSFSIDGEGVLHQY